MTFSENEYDWNIYVIFSHAIIIIVHIIYNDTILPLSKVVMLVKQLIAMP